MQFKNIANQSIALMQTAKIQTAALPFTSFSKLSSLINNMGRLED